MSLQPVVIAPFKTGLNTSVEPWLAPADAFTIADNVHVFHDYIEKREGYIPLGTLVPSDSSISSRVMGIQRYIEPDGTRETLAFDQKYAYLFNKEDETFDQLDVTEPNAPILNCGVYDYIQGANWESSNVSNRLYFTNGQPYDSTNKYNGIRYFTNDTPTITNLFTPDLGGGNTLYGGLLIFSIASRLVVLNTYEGETSSAAFRFPQRARWCAKQNPSAWSDIVAGGGDYADAATGDQIVSAQHLLNQIIVYFTNSVWSLIPTGDPNKAFRWVRLNSFRACDGKMASVAYDRFSKALGLRGITASDGNETQRIDQRILNFTTDELESSQFEKIFCFRDYEHQRWWTLYCDGENDTDENNRVLVFDDISGAFTTYSLPMNCLGYGVRDKDFTLEDFAVSTVYDLTLEMVGEATLKHYSFTGNEDLLLGGDISGNIYQMNFCGEDNTNPISSTLFTAAWNPFQAEGKEALLSYVDFYVDTDRTTSMKVDFYKNDEENPYTTQWIRFLPNLNFIAEIQDIDNSDPCLVEVPNHGLSTGNTIYIYGVESMDQINSGDGYTITVVNADSFTLNGINSTSYDLYTDGGAIYWNAFYQTKTWIRVYGGGVGFLHRLKLTLSGSDKPFRIHSIKPYFKARGRRTVN